MPNSEVVVITGVSSGIGRVTAEKFVKRGCQVFGTVRSTTKAQAIPGVVLVEMDIRDEASVQYGIQAIIAQARRIDVLVNSAQRGFPRQFKKISGKHRRPMASPARLSMPLWTCGRCAARLKARPLFWLNCAASCLQARLGQASGKRLGSPEIGSLLSRQSPNSTGFYSETLHNDFYYVGISI